MEKQFTVNGFNFVVTENGAEPFFSCGGFIFPMINTSLSDEEIQRELEGIIRRLVWDGQTYVLT